MSTAHRPTWDPAQARDVKGGSRQFSVRDMAAHTKLKFRATSAPELIAAEADARAKKRKAAGLPAEEPSAIGGLLTNGDGDEESNKRRRVLEEAMDLDRDVDSDDEKGDNDGDEEGSENGKGKGKDKADSIAEDEEDEDDSDEEDDTAELLRELEKIKRERAEEKARLEAAEGAVAAAARDEEIATANPLLNLAAALGQGPGVSTTRRARSR
ncbi:hypothetical protein EVG20_g6019 [Dentipellis fragilis]|uniref:Cwf15/Cwc15 cell cycle control protein n=1 Tax=Dentipellis fragilis TaxID=205917 RepID=A0A4Y9YR94_9AGAM|nr:hypothetical protein EVG20_g6019 [Dentipellis fragilis]